MAKRFDDASSEPEWGLYVDEQRRDLTARKSIKVKLPIRQHIKLHALKLFSENNISQTVEVALDMYFDRMRQQELAARAAVDGSGAGAGSDGAVSQDGMPGDTGVVHGEPPGSGSAFAPGTGGPGGPRAPGA